MIIVGKYLFILPILFSSVFADWETLYSHQREHTLEKGKILSKIPTFPKEWKIGFELFLTGFPRGTFSVFSVNGITSIIINSNPPTQRYSMVFNYHANGQLKHFENTRFSLQLNKWTRIEVSQLLEAGQYKLTVRVNWAKVGSDIISNSKEFKDVNLYASDPRYNPQPGKIRNLYIRSPRPRDHNDNRSV